MTVEHRDRLVAEHPTTTAPAGKACAGCVDAVHDFALGELNDDLTIVAVRWLPREATPDPRLLVETA